jgi:mannose-1-phosphate guanylyltransferase
MRRILPLAPASRTTIVTSEALAEATAAAAPGAEILAEPVGRNTAPCIAWAAAHVRRRDPDGVLAVLPADHHIGDEPGYLAVLERALGAASGGDLVTVGIEPTRPETGYGYIELGEPLAPGVHRAARFVEKPDRARAAELLAAGTFLWNSGMFFFRADAILDAIRAHLPALDDAVRAFDAAAAAGRETEEVAARYPALPAISIDHGVMEKSERVAVVPGDFGWSDLGSFTTAWELAPKDGAGNAVRADAILVDARRNYVSAPAKKLVALVGVEDLVVVDTEDALLVIPRDRAQDVRKIVEALEERGDERV